MDEGWARLGRLILHDRTRHWRTRQDFARAAGISARVLDDLEGGRRDNYLDETLAAVEIALGWRPGSCRRVVAGGRVAREVDPDLVRLMHAWAKLTADARAMLVEVAERAIRRG